MTVAELMAPRYEVTALFPGSLLNVGEILAAFPETRNGISYNVFRVSENHPAPALVDVTDARIFRDNINDYPVIFRPMGWWEKRQPEDMPQYVWMHDRLMIRQASCVQVSPDPAAQTDFYYCEPPLFYPVTMTGHKLRIPFSFTEVRPASEQEYKEFHRSRMSAEEYAFFFPE